VAGYKIYRGGSQIGTSASTAFNDTGLSAQTSYTYAVEAFDGAGNGSGQSAPISASTTFPDVTPPSVPSSLATSNVTTSAATITWAPSTDDFAVTGYQVFRNGIFLSNVATTSYTDTGLFASTTYSYAVAAFDLSGNVSVQSTPLNVTTAAVPLAPPSFVKLKEARVTSNTNSISTGSFATPVTSGNLIAVWIWYNSSTQKVSSMTDTAGNTYALAVGPTTGTGGMAGWRQELWYAKNVIGGTNLNVTATFTGMFNAEKSITAHEYSGLDQAAPLDVTAAAATSDANASTGLATTSFANELIFAGGLFQGSGSAGTGFTRRSSMASNVSEDKVVSSVGGYAGLFTNTAQAAIVQMAAFKAAGQ
jgi:chitodextrinase